MTKIAYNKCFGGFSLSSKGFEALLDRKGIEREGMEISYMMKYYRKGHANEPDAYLSEYSFYDNRTDPDLIAVIESLGSTANGAHANLQIMDLPVGTKYYIKEYDGMESIVTEDPRTETA